MYVMNVWTGANMTHVKTLAVFTGRFVFLFNAENAWSDKANIIYN